MKTDARRSPGASKIDLKSLQHRSRTLGGRLGRAGTSPRRAGRPRPGRQEGRLGGPSWPSWVQVGRPRRSQAASERSPNVSRASDSVRTAFGTIFRHFRRAAWCQCFVDFGSSTPRRHAKARGGRKNLENLSKIEPRARKIDARTPSGGSKIAAGALAAASRILF